MNDKIYLQLETPSMSIIIKGKDKTSYKHTVNVYSGKLVVFSSEEIINSNVDLSFPVMLPEQTTLSINVIGKNVNSKVSLDIRGMNHEEDNIVPYISHCNINFRNRIGIALADVYCDNKKLTLAMDICPLKMSYDSDYFSIVKDLQELSRGLVFDYLKSTSFSGKLNKNRDNLDLEWISTLINIFKELVTAFETIKKYPSKTLSNVRKQTRIEKIKKVNSTTVKSLVKGLGKGNIINISGFYVHEIIPSKVTSVSYDTPANIWLKSKLNIIIRRMNSVINQLSSNVARNNIVYDENKEFTYQLYKIQNQLTTLYNEDFLSGINANKSTSKPGLEVLGKKGYSDIYHVFEKLDSIFLISSGYDLLNSQDIAELYEEWCFFKVATTVGKLTNSSLSSEGLIELKKNNLRVKFAKNGLSVIKIDGYDKNRYNVAYNKEYHTLTGVQKPDIILEIKKDNYPGIIIVLDAKYRLQEYDSFGRKIKPQPPIDAINALHRYRDAIYLEYNKRKIRPTVKCVILHPVVAEENNVHESNFWKSIFEIGIGAIPLSPSHDEFLLEFINDLLNKDFSEICIPGLPYEPYESMIRNK